MVFGLKRFLPALAVGIGLALGGTAALAAGPYDKLERGPAVGTVMPHDLNTVDQENRYRDFKSLARKRGLIVLFSRSVGW